MSWVNRLLRTLRPGRLNDDLSDELQFHIERRTEDLIQAGLDPEEARRQAAARFGNRTQQQERTRERDILVWLETGWQDIRYALRGFRRNPVFTLTAVLSLALGIGANTAIFSVIDALLLRSLPVRDPQQLVQVMIWQDRKFYRDSFSYPVVRALAEQKQIFSGLCGFAGMSINVGPADRVEAMLGAWVSGQYYETLGIIPVAGRLIGPEDDRSGAAVVAVITEEYWDRKYSRDPGAVGKKILIEGVPVTIAGISPRGFAGAEVGRVAEITLPLAAMAQIYPELPGRLSAGAEYLRILARPQAGISMQQAKARLAVAWPQLAAVAVHPRMAPARRNALLNSTLDLIPGATGYSYLRAQYRQPLAILMALAGLVLLIACCNLATLLLARTQARSREFAVRIAIGAGRTRLIRQLLTEGVLLSICAASVGLGVAQTVRIPVRILSTGVTGTPVFSFDLAPNLHLLGFSAAVAIAAGVLFGLAPAWRVVAIRASAGRRLTWTLVTAQIAISFLLVTGAGLFVRTLQNLQKVDLGFRREGVFLVLADTRRASTPALAALYRERLQALRRIEGVTAVSLSSNVPLNNSYWTDAVSIRGQAQAGEVHFNSIAPEFFGAMRTPFISGRDFTLEDESSAIVNEAFVRRYFPHENPLGERVSSRSFPNLQIVGVVRDTISQDLRQAPPPAVYVPFFHFATEFPMFVVRAGGSLAEVSAGLRRELQPIMPGRTVQIRTLTGQMEFALARERVMALLASSFGVLALVLAGVGLYGLLAYTVERRTGEVGIRMALGAARTHVLALVLRDAARLLAIGIAIGIPSAWAVSRLVKSMLFALTPNDPATLIGAGLILLATGLLAAFLPARRASRVDPLIALRCD